MKWIKTLFVACFVAFIALVGIGTLDNKEPQSPIEARMLTQFPDLDYSKLKDETYLTTISNAFSDQLSDREEKIKKYNNLIVNKLHMKYVGAVSIGKNGNLYEQPQMIEDYTAYDKEAVKCAKLINKEAAKIAKTGAKFIFISIPRKDVVMRDDLPSYYPDSEKDYERYIKIMKKELSSDVILIDAKEILEKSDNKQVYYKVDHHVNATGGQLLYQRIMEIAKEEFPETEVKTLDDYRVKKNAVKGSFNRKLAYVLPWEKEELNVRPKWKLKYHRESSKVPLFGKDNTYGSAFMGSDYAYTKITTEQKKAPSFVLCGSSFTNILEAFLVPSSRQMISFDYRHNNSEKSLADQVKEIKPDYVIYMPNQSDIHFSYDTFKLHLGLK